MKVLVTNYTFNPTSKTVTFTNYSSIVLERVLLITNVTDNVIIYNFADSTKTGTVSSNALTLQYDTSSMSSEDKLQIFYDDPSTGTPTETLPSIATATSTTLLAANPIRKYLLIQNNSSTNVLISLSGATLTSVTPSTGNTGIVLSPGTSYESPSHYCSTAAVTAYQTSGGAISTISCLEG